MNRDVGSPKLVYTGKKKSEKYVHWGEIKIIFGSLNSRET